MDSICSHEKQNTGKKVSQGPRLWVFLAPTRVLSNCGKEIARKAHRQDKGTQTRETQMQIGGASG